jgi:hypothetical protein
VASRCLFVCRAATMVCLLALAWVGETHAAGFDQYYEVRVGDSDNDGVADDLYVRQKPRVVLIDVGDVMAPIVTPGDVAEFLLEYGGSGFTMKANLSSSQKRQYASWPVANVETTLGDLNADGVTDLIVKGINALPGLTAALDQIVFASTTVRRAPPVHVKGVDESVRRFFRDLAGHSKNINYYFQTAIQNNWYHIDKGPVVTSYWSIIYLRYWGFTWNNGAIRASDSTVDDIFNPNKMPALCTYFTCRWTTDRWYAYASARQQDVILHYENFSQSARGLEGTINTLVSSGGLDCGSANATAFANATQSVLGIQVWGGALTNCSILEHESVFSASELAKARLGFLFGYLQAATTTLEPRSNRGDPTQNQADLEAALTYLKQSATFRALWEQFQKLKVKIVVHRNAEDEFLRPDQIIWDPDSGLVLQAGIASPALGLAHEIAHAVRYQTDYKGFMKDFPWTSGMVPDPNDPNHMIVTRTPSAEEERAADVDAAIGAELGEPLRTNYADGANGDVLVAGPTFKCFRGNPTCDTLIDNQQNP